MLSTYINVILILLMPIIAICIMCTVNVRQKVSIINLKRVSLLTLIFNSFFLIQLLMKNIFYIGTQYNFKTNIELFTFKGHAIIYEIYIDVISLIFILITTVTFIFSFYIADVTKNSKIDFILKMLLYFCLVSFFSNANLLFIYISIELAFIIVFFLMLNQNNSNKENLIPTALKFLLYNVLSSTFLLLVIIDMWSVTGTLNIIHIYEYHSYKNHSLVYFIFIMLSIFIKIGLFPFHGWVRQTYQNLSNDMTIVMMSILSKVGIYIFLRICFSNFIVDITAYLNYIYLYCFINMLYFMCLMLYEERIKSKLAYLSITHIIFIIVGLSSLNIVGLQGAIYQSISHSIISIATFMPYIIINNQLGVEKVNQFPYIAKKMPIPALFFSLAMIFQVSLPGTMGFVGEFLIFNSIYVTLQLFSIFFIFIIVFVLPYLVLKLNKDFIYSDVVLDNSQVNDGVYKLNLLNFVLLLVCTLVIILLGFFPDWILDSIYNYSLTMLDIVKSSLLFFDIK